MREKAVFSEGSGWNKNWFIWTCIELEGLVGKDYYGETKYLNPLDTRTIGLIILKIKKNVT